jgi:RNA-directed DNA polymerase
MHCATEQQARRVLAALEERMADVGLELHPDKTRIVYCKDRNRRRSDCADTSFTFPGCTFRARQAPARQGGGAMSSAFLPAVSKDALKRMSGEVRAWRIHTRSGTELEDIATWINPVLRSWMACYGRFCRTALNGLLQRISTYLVRWAKRKYKRLRTFRKVRKWWDGLTARQPRLFAHWAWVTDFKYSL